MDVVFYLCAYSALSTVSECVVFSDPCFGCLLNFSRRLLLPQVNGVYTTVTPEQALLNGMPRTARQACPGLSAPGTAEWQEIAS